MFVRRERAFLIRYKTLVDFLLEEEMCIWGRGGDDDGLKWMFSAEKFCWFPFRRWFILEKDAVGDGTIFEKETKTSVEIFDFRTILCSSLFLVLSAHRSFWKRGLWCKENYFYLPFFKWMQLYSLLNFCVFCFKVSKVAISCLEWRGRVKALRNMIQVLHHFSAN